MQGPDTVYDNPELGLEAPSDNSFWFSGKGGLSYEQFLQRIRGIAFEQGKSRDPAWIADLFPLHLSGDASKWFENLDDQIQQDWNLLKRAFIEKYGEKVKGKAGPIIDALLPARIAIASWSSPVQSSSIRFLKSKDEWLREAKQRKSKFSDNRRTVYWHLVEPSEWVPDNLIPVSLESGVTMYSIRVWQDGGLTLGKLATNGHTKRAWIYWAGKEVGWNDSFEVLVGDQNAVRWVTPRSAYQFVAVEGGFQLGNDKALLVALCQLKECTQPGKVFSGDYKAYYGWWGKEGTVEDFRVLAWA